MSRSFSLFITDDDDDEELKPTSTSLNAITKSETKSTAAPPPPPPPQSPSPPPSKQDASTSPRTNSSILLPRETGSSASIAPKRRRSSRGKRKRRRSRRSQQQQTQTQSNLGLAIKASLSGKLRRLSYEQPPQTNPIGFLVSAAAICCVGTAVSCTFCVLVALFLFIMVFPLIAFVIGLLYSGECGETNIPDILIVGGIFHFFHVTIAAFFTFRTLKRFRNSQSSGGDEDNDAETEDQGGGDSGSIRSRSNSIQTARRISIYPAPDVEAQTQSQFAGLLAPAPASRHPSVDAETQVDIPRTDVVKLYFQVANCILILFNLVWFVYASYKVFGTHYQGMQGNCSDVPFYFALWYVILIYVFIGIILLMSVLCCCTFRLGFSIYKNWRRRKDERDILG